MRHDDHVNPLAFPSLPPSSSTFLSRLVFTAAQRRLVMTAVVAASILIFAQRVSAQTTTSETADNVEELKQKIAQIDGEVSSLNAKLSELRTLQAGRVKEYTDMKARHDSIQNEYERRAHSWNSQCAASTQYDANYYSCISSRDELMRFKAQNEPQLKAMENRADELNRVGVQTDNDINLVSQRIQELTTSRSQMEALISSVDARIKESKTASVHMSESAADLVSALNLVAEHMKLSKASVHSRALYDLRCQEFFRALADELQRRGKPSWNTFFKQGLQARGIIVQIQKDSTHWKQLEGTQEQIWQRAQELANAGNIVVGGYLPSDKTLHGHLAVVMPIPSGFDRSKLESPGTGPFVRDGNDHYSKTTGNTYPLGYGTASASKAMPLTSKTTHWYVWNDGN